MKVKLFIFSSFCSLFLLSGCSSMCSDDGCGYYDYDSQCGLPSCTDNTYIDYTYTTSCPDAYDCYNYF